MVPVLMIVAAALEASMAITEAVIRPVVSLVTRPPPRRLMPATVPVMPDALSMNAAMLDLTWMPIDPAIEPPDWLET